MVKIKRFFECNLPVTVCNLECKYCYIIQQSRRHMKMTEIEYTAEQIAYALRKERLGGVCFFSLCGNGETMLQRELVPIVKALLDEGHYINITTNGTVTERINALIDICKDNISHLHISFSFHYLELKRKNLLDVFFSNINKVKNAGASILLQMNLYDEYIPYLDEIKELSIQNVGAVPQLALTRKGDCEDFVIHSDLSPEEYLAVGSTFESPLFEFTNKNFNVKRNEFCYAGDWSGVIDFRTGWLSRCYENKEGQNIFENPDIPIDFKAVGKNCRSPYCVNSSHFMSFGVIPSIDTPTYGSLRDRAEASWQNEEMREALNSKLSESNKKYGILKKTDYAARRSYRKIRRKINKLRSK